MEHYTNLYRCDCGAEWQDDWDCQCNDRCPKCNSETEPYKSTDNWEDLPYNIYTVTAKLVGDELDLDPEDKEFLESILEPYSTQARCKEEALDIYHCNIPISCLEDFEFKVTKNG